MSIAEAPQPAAPAAAQPLPAPPDGAPARTARRPSPLDHLWSPAIVVLTAGLVLVASLGGGSLQADTTAQLLALLGGGALLVASVLRAEDGRLPGGLPVLAFGLLAALTALSIQWAADPNAAWLEANRTLAYAAAFTGAAALATLARDRYAALAGGLLLGVCVVAGVALMSKIVPEWLNESERFARLREPFGYWNAVGLTGALAVPASLWLGSRRHGAPLLNALAYPALTLALTATLLAYSRGSLLAGAAGAAVWFVLVPARRLRGAAVLLLGAAAAAFVAAWSFGQHALTEDRVDLVERGAAGRELLVCLVAVLLLVYVAGVTVGFLSDLRPLRLQQRRGLGLALLACVALTPFAVAGVLSTTDEGLGGSISTAWKTITDPKAEPPPNSPDRLTDTGSIRARYWDDAWRMAKDRPAAGWGAGAFAVVRPRYRTDDIDVRHAHGYIAQTLSDLGLAGMGLSLLLLGAWLWAARRAIRAASGPLRTALVTLTATGVVFGVHSLVDWTWFTMGTALAGLIAAGFVAGAAPPGRMTPRVSGPARLAAAAVLALVALTAAWAAWQPLRSHHAADDALAAAEAGDVEQARADARRAHDLNPLAAEPWQALASAERRGGDLEAAEQALRRAVDTQPANYETWLALAEFQLWVRDDPREALHSVRAAVYLNPGSFRVIQRYLDISRTLRGREASGG
jgi:hypothetical protein